MKQLDMKAFAGSGFDIEMSGAKSSEYWTIYPYGLMEYESEVNINEYLIYRPRLNKPQVLDDYSKVLIDGLVWRVRLRHSVRHSHDYTIENKLHTSKSIRKLILKRSLVWIECIGVEDKPEWRYESDRLSMPLIKV